MKHLPMLPVLLVLLVLMTWSAISSAVRAELPDCAALGGFAVSDKKLPRLAAAIQRGGELVAVAVGSATTVGADPGGVKGASFPYRMAEALRAAAPGVQVALTVRGGRGLTAEAMLPLLKGAMTQRPAVVLWQTGTVEAVRNIAPDALRVVLDAGIQAIRAAGGDAILIDPQFSRFVRSNTDIEPYRNVLRQAAEQPGVALFNRFDLMRAWANEGLIDLEREPKPEREKAVARLNACLGQALARFMVTAAR
jgi:acyl-CoA thioesterase-1